MQCAEAKEHLSDLNRGRLEPQIDKAVRSHVEHCAECSADLQAEAEIRTLIRTQVKRFTTPPGLRTRIQANMAQAAPRGWSLWIDWLRGHVWATSGLAGAMAVLLLVWAGGLWLTRDPLSPIMTRAVVEHTEYAKEMMNRPVPDPQAVVGELRSQASFSFEPVFPGDSGVQLVGTLMSDLPGKRAATLVYRDTAGRYTTLFLMPGAGTVIPDGGRMQIESFKPYHRVASGHQVLLWKQKDLACLIVSDLDQPGLAAMFLKIRKAV
jgi:anti-sigma factor (TIGR02949 family)